MSNSKLFKQAHAMTRATIQAGDDYRTTFGLCLKQIKADAIKAAKFATIKAKVTAVYMFIAKAILAVLIASPIIAAGTGLAHGIQYSKERTEKRQYDRAIDYAASFNYLNRFNNQ